MAKARGATTEELEKLKQCSAGDCYDREKLILKLNSEISVCPIEKHYDANVAVAFSALQNSIAVGLEHLHAFSSPGGRERANEELDARRHEIYDDIDDVSSTDYESSDGMPATADEMEEGRGAANWTRLRDHVQEGNHIEVQQPSVIQRIRRSASVVGNWLDRFDT